jgi:F-type H+-transporting ATPase subunit epsilon
MAAGNIKLEIVTPEKVVVSEDAQIVMAPGELGEFGVLIGHTPFMTALKLGTIRYVDASGKERFVFISGGFAEALPNKVTVLAESAERRAHIDTERAKSALQRAQERLAKEDDHTIDRERARSAMERALHRLKIAAVRTS